MANTSAARLAAPGARDAVAVDHRGERQPDRDAQRLRPRRAAPRPRAAAGTVSQASTSAPASASSAIRGRWNARSSATVSRRRAPAMGARRRRCTPSRRPARRRRGRPSRRPSPRRPRRASSTERGDQPPRGGRVRPGRGEPVDRRLVARRRRHLRAGGGEGGVRGDDRRPGRRAAAGPTTAPRRGRRPARLELGRQPAVQERRDRRRARRRGGGGGIAPIVVLRTRAAPRRIGTWCSSGEWGGNAAVAGPATGRDPVTGRARVGRWPAGWGGHAPGYGYGRRGYGGGGGGGSCLRDLLFLDAGCCLAESLGDGCLLALGPTLRARALRTHGAGRPRVRRPDDRRDPRLPARDQPAPGPVCHFTPSCSAYAVEAIETHGARRGAWLTARRLLRCRPGAARGADPVPAAA